MLMCMATAMVGVVAVLRRRALVGETLAHATYPGVLFVASFIIAWGFRGEEEVAGGWMALGAAVTAWLGYVALTYLESWKVRPDSALCFILASFFGVGLLCASRLQVVSAKWYRIGQTYLFGQAATLTDRDVWIYLALALAVSILLWVFYRDILTVCFDREFAACIGIPLRMTEAILSVLLVASIVIGLRSVGLVLMSAMLIIPAVTARQWAQSLGKIFCLAAIFGLSAGFLGIVGSVEGSQYLSSGGKPLVLATGPMIVMAALSLCLISLLLAPERGLVAKMQRQLRFQKKCEEENLLKDLWNAPAHQKDLRTLSKMMGRSLFRIRWLCWRLYRQGWVVYSSPEHVTLTSDGQKRGAWVVRLHRLWELYLVDALGLGVERVHRSAEEMEHLLTPEIESKLSALLQQPKWDPHHQPIPSEGMPTS